MLSTCLSCLSLPTEPADVELARSRANALETEYERVCEDLKRERARIAGRRLSIDTILASEEGRALDKERAVLK